MTDTIRTPRGGTPYVTRAPIFREIAEWWADALRAETIALESLHEPGELSRAKSLKCQATAMRMQAMALEFAACILDYPGDEAFRMIDARWQTRQAEARERLPGRNFGT